MVASNRTKKSKESILLPKLGEIVDILHRHHVALVKLERGEVLSAVLSMQKELSDRITRLESR